MCVCVHSALRFVLHLMWKTGHCAVFYYNYYSDNTEEQMETQGGKQKLNTVLQAFDLF